MKLLKMGVDSVQRFYDRDCMVKHECADMAPHYRMLGKEGDRSDYMSCIILEEGFLPNKCAKKIIYHPF